MTGRLVESTPGDYFVPLADVQLASEMSGLTIRNPNACPPLQCGHGNRMESTQRVIGNDGTVKPYICTVTRDEYVRRVDRHDRDREAMAKRKPVHVPGCYRLFSTGKPVFWRRIHKVCPDHFSLRQA